MQFKQYENENVRLDTLNFDEEDVTQLSSSEEKVCLPFRCLVFSYFPCYAKMTITLDDVTTNDLFKINAY